VRVQTDDELHTLVRVIDDMRMREMAEHTHARAISAPFAMQPQSITRVYSHRVGSHAKAMAGCAAMQQFEGSEVACKFLETGSV
jgi:hypothetical protein